MMTAEEFTSICEKYTQVRKYGVNCIVCLLDELIVASLKDGIIFTVNIDLLTYRHDEDSNHIYLAINQESSMNPAVKLNPPYEENLRKYMDSLITRYKEIRKEMIVSRIRNT